MAVRRNTAGVPRKTETKNEAAKRLIGSICPGCGRGELKKKYNRQVKPAKPFIGCSNYPRCTHSYEMDGSPPKPPEYGMWDYFDDHPHSSGALGQS